MTETLLSLAPVYGPWLVVASVFLSCLALPLPSTILVMTAGGFAAVGDLVLWQSMLGAFGGFVAGDQAAFRIARGAGAGVIGRARGKRRIGALIAKAEALLHRRGALAVLLSRTVLSPLGPYVTYTAGGLGLPWLRFSIAAVIGAAIWSGFYSALGYTFADNIAEVAALLGNALGLIALLTIAGLSGFWLWRGYRAYLREQRSAQFRLRRRSRGASGTPAAPADQTNP